MTTEIELNTTHDKLNEILHLTRETHAAIAEIRDQVNAIVPEVKPMVDALAASPIFRAIAKVKK